MPKWLKRNLSRHMLSTVPAGLGMRSDEGHPSAPPAPAGESAPAEGQPAGQDPADPPVDDAPKGDETDWKKTSRDWEKRAKANAKAAEELEKLRASQMSEQEKAVAAAKAEGHAEAMKTAGKKLAAAELNSAAKDKGLNLSDIQEYLKADMFVDENGDVDSAAIKKAVTAFAKIAPPPAPGKSGAPLPGGSGGRPTTTATLDSAVAARYGG